MSESGSDYMARAASRRGVRSARRAPTRAVRSRSHRDDPPTPERGTGEDKPMANRVETEEEPRQGEDQGDSEAVQASRDTGTSVSVELPPRDHQWLVSVGSALGEDPAVILARLVRRARCADPTKGGTIDPATASTVPAGSFNMPGE